MAVSAQGPYLQAERDSPLFIRVISGSTVQSHAGHWLRSDRSEEHTSELQSQSNLVCRLLLEKKKKIDDVILVGCSRRLHAAQQDARGLTAGKEPKVTLNPDDVVPLSRTIPAGVVKGDVLDVR